MKNKIGKKTIIVISFITAFLSLELIYIWLDMNYFSCNKTYSDFKNVPSSMEIGEVRITMTSYLGRDFMPIQYTHPLGCIITLATEISSDMLTKIHISKFWAFISNSTWYIPHLENQIFESKTMLKILIGNGPDNDLWQEGTLVDVVLQFRYGLNLYYLQSIDVPIVYTW